MVIKPAELLEDLCVVRALDQDPFVRFFGLLELQRGLGLHGVEEKWREITYVLGLLVDVTDLEPDVQIGERSWRIPEDAIEALRIVVRTRV